MNLQPKRPRGLSMIELLIVASLMAILAGLAIVPAGANDGAQAQAAGRLFSGMVEYAQSLAVARPDQTYLIKVDPAQGKFWVANAAAPDTPLTHPVTKQPYRVAVGPGSPDGLGSLQIASISLDGDSVVKFDSTGAMDQTVPASVEFSCNGTTYAITVAPLTGVVKVSAVQVISGETVLVELVN